MEKWNPEQYEKFKKQRSRPAYDLMNLIRPAKFSQAVDLGCGTGELTAELFSKLHPGHMRGIDSSESMLAKAKAFENPQLKFERAQIEELELTGVDLIFSNACLQWVPDHESLLPRLLNSVSRGGQIAWQMPANFDHVSHTTAVEVAAEFGVQTQPRPVLPIERYAAILFENGFEDQDCRMQIYLHPMASAHDVVEWTKGTFLTQYRAVMSSDTYLAFEAAYRSRLVDRLGDVPLLYSYKRLLLWGVKT